MHQTTSDNQQLKDNFKELKGAKDAERAQGNKLLYTYLSTRLKAA